MANRLDKVASDILSVNAAVKELSDRFDDYLFESAYGVLDTALPAGTRITTISLESALKGAIPVNAFFVISFPDGSNPLVIQNRKEELDTDTTDIEIYDDGTKDWEQDITPNVTYPVGSILSSVNYASNEGNLIGDLTGNIIFRINNDEGANIPAGSPIYSKGEIGQSDRIDVGICDANDSTKMPCIGIAMTTLTTTGDGAKGDAMLSGILHTDITGFTSLAVGDILYIQNDGSLSQTKPSGETSLIQNVGVVLKTNGTTCQSLKVTAIGRTNDVPNLNENHLFIGDATNCAVSTNAPMVSIIKAADGDAARTLVNADPAGVGTGANKPIQFNDNGDFSAESTLTNLSFDTTNKILYAQKISTTGGVFFNLNATILGNIELGHSSDTTLSRISAGVVGIEGKEIVTKNKQRHVINCGFYHGTSSIVYLPFGYGGTMDSTSSSGYLEFGGYVAPCDGYVDYVVVRGENAGGNTTVGFITAPAGQEVPIISPGAGISDTTNMAVDDTGYRFDNFTNAGGTVTNTFSAGDVIMFTLNTTTQLNDAIATAVLVFDWDNEL